MSASIMGNVFYLNVKPTRKLVLVALADNANDDGFCWPSQRLIALKASISERKCRDHLHALEQDGWVKIIPGRGPGRVSHYNIDVEKIQQVASTRKEQIDFEKRLPR